MIRLHQLSKSFDGGRTYAVSELSLDVPEGKTLVLLGSSGSGKTTVLKMINGLVEPTAGSIQIDGRDTRQIDPTQLRRSVGYAFQGIGLFPHMTVEENATIVLRLLGRPATARRRRARELLDLVGLDPSAYAQRVPAQLSGGQQQRVGVARALAADPAYLLMDEPFGALDAVTRHGLQQEFRRITRQLGKTTVFVTHDLFEAAALADDIAVLHNGGLEQAGTRREVLGHPATDFVAELVARPRRQAEMLKELSA